MTIIVLLVLAGVTVNLVVGNNGIIASTMGSVRETSNAGTGSKSWDGGTSGFTGLYYPLLECGGCLSYGGVSGLFNFVLSNGGSNYVSGFRPVIVPIK